MLAPKRKIALDKEVFGIHFRNPIGVAAGFDSDGDRLEELAAVGFGFVEIGSVMSTTKSVCSKPYLFCTLFSRYI